MGTATENLSMYNSSAGFHQSAERWGFLRFVASVRYVKEINYIKSTILLHVISYLGFPRIWNPQSSMDLGFYFHRMANLQKVIPNFLLSIIVNGKLYKPWHLAFSHNMHCRLGASYPWMISFFTQLHRDL